MEQIISLYAEVNIAFNLSDMAITLRGMLKNRIDKEATDILYIYPIHSAKKYRDDKEKGIYYRAAEDVFYTNFLRGRRFKEIIFID